MSYTNKTVRFALTKGGVWWESTSETLQPRPPRWRTVIAVAAPIVGLANLVAHIQQLTS